MGQWKRVVSLCACLGDDGDVDLESQMWRLLWTGLAGHCDLVPCRTKILPLDSSIAYHSSLLQDACLL